MARETERSSKEKKYASCSRPSASEGILPGRLQPLFCRFIPTAEYVARELRIDFRSVEVVAVTGTLPPTDAKRASAHSKAPKRVLVCTDCLSEGINLQEHFDAVMHYDLSWNPTRHEQREGRVDRYGQPSRTVACSPSMAQTTRSTAL